MPRAVRFAPLLLLIAAAPATQPAAAIDVLIGQLASPDAAIRTSAAAELIRLGESARPALRRASHDPRPAVAEAAAGLILNGQWWTKTDAQSIHLVLMSYGKLPPDERASLIQTLIDPKNNLPHYRDVACRVLAADPADEVAWTVVYAFFDFDNANRVQNVDAAWEAALDKLDPATRPPALTLLLARCREMRGDTDAALDLYARVLDQERDRPTTSGKSLNYAVMQVVAAEQDKGHYANAARLLREQFARSDDQSTSQPDLIGKLLDLHAQHGPLPGLAADLRAAGGDDGEDHSGIAIGVLAGRAGFPVASRTIISAAVADRPGETDLDRVVRLKDAGDTLAALGRPEAAKGVFERLVLVEAENARGYIPLGYDRLSQLHAAAGELQEAGDDLQRALDRQNGTNLLRRRNRNGPYEPWPLEDEQAQCYWYWLRAAQARHDDAAAAEQARKIVASGATDSNLFLEILPAIQTAASGEEVDAYFDRVFAVEKARLDAKPDDPTQLNDLAWLCGRSNRKLPEALAWSTKAVQLAPLQSAFLDTLAELKYRTGDARAAVALEEKALAAHPDDEPFMRGQLDRFRAAAATQPATMPATKP